MSCLLVFVAVQLLGQAQLLPQGWRITPAGQHIPLTGDFPSKIIENKDGTRVFVVTSGYHHQGLTIIDGTSNTVASTADLGKVYSDMAFDNNSGRVFIAAGGSAKPLEFFHRLHFLSEDAAVIRGIVRDDKFTLETPLEIPELDARSRYISGVALGRDGALFAVNINTDTLYRLSASLCSRGQCKGGLWRLPASRFA